MLTRRRIILCSAPLSALTVLALWLWLETGPLRRHVIAAISQQYDGYVDVDRVALQVQGGIVIRGLRLRSGVDSESPLVCEVPRIDLRGSFWDLLRGQFHPDAVCIRKPVFRLRQDPDGKWLLNLPLRAPAQATDLPQTPVEIRDGSLELYFANSESQQPRRISGIALTTQQAR